MAYGIIAPSGRAKNFVKRMLPELDSENYPTGKDS
jgi:hypothetical protein